MSAMRTQVYLTEDQRRRIDVLSEAEGLSLAEVIRRALDAYLNEVEADPTQALATTFGAVTELAPPSRDEWDRG